MIGEIIGGVAANVFGGLLGSAASSGDRAAALQANKDALKQWMDINIPDPAEQRIYLQHYVQTGQLAPKLQQAVQREKSAMENVQVDPRFKEAQLKALSSLEDLGNQGGMNLEDRAALQKNEADNAARERGTRDALTQKFAAQGKGGSGFELAAQLEAQQGAQNRSSQAGLDTLAASRKRALDAILGSGQLAGQLGEQDYSRQSNLAKSRDAIADFNARNLQNVNNANVGILNDADKYNLGLKQQIANSNVDLVNAQEKHNKGLYQQQFENRARKAQGMSGNYNQMADAYSGNANRTAGQYAGVGNAIGQGFNAYGQYNANKEYLDKRYGNSPGGQTSNQWTTSDLGSKYRPDDEKEWWA